MTVGPSCNLRLDSTWFLPRFLFIALVSGSTLGMAKVMLSLLAISIGLSTTELGFINGVEGAMIALLSLPAGVAVARCGPRPIYILASILAAVCYALVPYTKSAVYLALCISLCSVFSSFRIVAMAGAFMELLPRLGSGRAGWFRAALMTGLVLIGPVIGPLFVEALGTTGAYSVVSACFVFMALAGPTVLPRFSGSQARSSLARDMFDIFNVLMKRSVAPVVVMELATAMIASYFASFIIIIAVRSFGWPVQDAVWLVFGEGATAIITMIVGGHLLKDKHPVALYIIAAVLIVAGLSTLSHFRTFAILALGATAMAAGHGIMHVRNVRALSDVDEDKSKLASLQTLCTTVGAALGAFLGGIVAEIVGMQGVFLWAGLAYAGIAIMTFANICSSHSAAHAGKTPDPIERLSVPVV